MIAVVLIPNAVVAVLVLLPAGLAWITVLSTMNASLQLFLPEWVRARGLSVYLSVLFGSQAVGAVAWGVVAAPAGVVPAYLAAAALMLGGAATIAFWPLIDTATMDRQTVALSEPQLALDTAPDEGPVVVSITYTIAAEREAAFLKAMVRVRLSRLRTGATQWGLFRNGEAAHEFVELFVVSSWDEYLRQRSLDRDRHGISRRCEVAVRSTRAHIAPDRSGAAGLSARSVGRGPRSAPDARIPHLEPDEPLQTHSETSLCTHDHQQHALAGGAPQDGSR